ncbi:MAG TPA: ATP-binding protein [Holophagaceae bacterium]
MNKPSNSAARILGGVLVVGACTSLGWVTRAQGNLAFLVMVYLLGVTFVALRWGRLASGVAVALSSLAFDYFFETPAFRLAVENWPNFLVFSGMMVIAQVVAGLVHRLRLQAAEALARERETARLYELSRSLARMAASLDLVRTATAFLETETGGPVSMALDHVPAGSDPTHLSLHGSRGVLGHLQLPASPDPVRRPFLEACASQIALALERALMAEAAERAELDAETERSRNALLTSVSHDLRTPLSTISGAAGTLVQEGEDLPPEERRDLAALILEEARRLDHLIGNLLEITSLEHGSVRLSREWQPLEEVVGAALTRMESRCEEVPVEVALPADLPLVPMDGVLVEQLFLNLLENALRHAPGARIRLGARVEGEVLQVEVADEGPGIPEADRERIFEKFFRRAGSRGDGGSGLGLAICRAIVEAHGGRIRVEEAPGGGAAFRFTLPLHPDTPVPSASGGFRD